MRRAAAEDRVALIPMATLEDHGRHLPVDTDLRIVQEICRRAAERASDRTVLLPAIPHGYDPHHMDFPGPISIAWDTFTRYCADVGRSLAHHGFRRMLYLNGHGSNQNLVETAARLVAYVDELRQAAAGQAGAVSVRATRFGAPLRPGGTIGVPAPASPWENRSELLRGVQWWQARGYRVKLAGGIDAATPTSPARPRRAPAT